MNKKGWVQKRSLYSFLAGLIFGALGFFSLLNDLGRGVAGLPSMIYSLTLVKIALIILGLIILYDSFRISYGAKKLLSIIAGLILAFLGILPSAVELDVVKASLPFNIDIVLSPLILHAVLIAYAAYLIINAFMMKPEWDGLGIASKTKWLRSKKF
ncbi:hypothetical protein HY643_04935 [Candidatus Woesearchaeota archaeon]|nr:hypothetical protein [Candidatus Woesearchaeota archaeon]